MSMPPPEKSEDNGSQDSDSDVSSVEDPEEYIEFDWYNEDVELYDIIFQTDTDREADFLMSIFQRHEDAIMAEYRLQNNDKIHVLEPACGTGRLMLALAQRGCLVTGVDLSAKALEFARGKLTDARVSGFSLENTDICEFELDGCYDFAHIMVSSIKYLLTNDQLNRHVNCMHRALKPRGLYIVALHIVDYEYYEEQGERERWIESRQGKIIDCKILSSPPDPETRLEHCDAFIDIIDETTRERVKRLKTAWTMRTYSCDELFDWVQSIGNLFELIGLYDFDYDTNKRCDPRIFDDQLDVVLVLRAMK